MSQNCLPSAISDQDTTSSADLVCTCMHLACASMTWQILPILSSPLPPFACAPLCLRRRWLHWHRQQARILHLFTACCNGPPSLDIDHQVADLRNRGMLFQYFYECHCPGKLSLPPLQLLEPT